MKYRTRRYFTPTEDILMWDRWQAADSLHEIARLLGRSHGRPFLDPSDYRISTSFSKAYRPDQCPN